jgi:hypothetical protein
MAYPLYEETGFVLRDNTAMERLVPICKASGTGVGLVDVTKHHTDAYSPLNIDGSHGLALGGSGLVSTAADYLAFMHMLANQGGGCFFRGIGGAPWFLRPRYRQAPGTGTKYYSRARWL